MVSVGTIVWLSSELMFFAGLFAMYFTARAQAGGDWPPHPTELNLVSGGPGDAGADRVVVHLPDGRVRRRARRRVRAAPLVRDHVPDGRCSSSSARATSTSTWSTHGTTIPGSAYGSVFYLATGFHGLHVIGGLIAFIFLLARTTMSKFTPAQATAAIVVSYYWHFVDIVWIALFATIYFVR